MPSGILTWEAVAFDDFDDIAFPCILGMDLRSTAGPCGFRGGFLRGVSKAMLVTQLRL